MHNVSKYRKTPIICPGLVFVQKGLLLGLFSELICGGAYYWKEFCVSKWVGLDNNSLKHYEKKSSLTELKTASTDSPWAYIRECLLSEGILRLRLGGGGVEGWAYFREGLFFGGGLIVGILRYISQRGVSYRVQKLTFSIAEAS